MTEQQYQTILRLVANAYIRRRKEVRKNEVLQKGKEKQDS